MKSEFKQIIKGLLIAAILVSAPISASTGNWLNSVSYRQFFYSGSSFDSALSGLEALSVKLNQAYDESQDPAMHKSSSPEEGPKHGFFAVSAVIIGIFGLFIYFLRVD